MVGQGNMAGHWQHLTTSSWYKYPFPIYHSRLSTTSNSLLEEDRVHIIFQKQDSFIKVGHILLWSVWKK